MKISDLHPAKYNPRKTLKPGDKEWEALKNSLERFGVAAPLVVNKATMTLISGHQRLNVLKHNGEEEVEVVLADVDDEQEKLLNIALNKIDGEWDYKKLEALFDEISEEDIKFTGFDAEELTSLFDGGLPSWDTDDEESEEQPEQETKEQEEKEDKPEVEKPFNIFLSFPTKELAEKWLKDRDIEMEFTGTARNITIRMEGIGYGTGN
ncbi:MAG: ParB N-terminal domain-containing protein [Ruminococcus sp.]|nr:ParB N-terminal domain-containing protein [Ruminococcus sp.]